MRRRTYRAGCTSDKTAPRIPLLTLQKYDYNTEATRTTDIVQAKSSSPLASTDRTSPFEVRPKKGHGTIEARFGDVAFVIREGWPSGLRRWS